MEGLDVPDDRQPLDVIARGNDDLAARCRAGRWTCWRSRAGIPPAEWIRERRSGPALLDGTRTTRQPPNALHLADPAAGGHLDGDPLARLDPSMTSWMMCARQNALSYVDDGHLVEIGQFPTSQGNPGPPGCAPTCEICSWWPPGCAPTRREGLLEALLEGELLLEVDPSMATWRTIPRWTAAARCAPGMRSPGQARSLDGHLEGDPPLERLRRPPGAAAVLERAPRPGTSA